MQSYVFQRPRGKGKRSKYWTGRYSLGRKQPYIEVALGLTDKPAALAKLHQIVIEAQREATGLLPPRRLRAAAAASLGSLLGEYHADLLGQKRTPEYAKVVGYRIREIIKFTGWRHLSDITSESFMAWRAQASLSAKTLKEYQAAINALLNWLVRSDRLERNPLAKVRKPDIRGKAVRPSRAFTLDELAAFFDAAKTPSHRIAFMLLAYTGQRVKEIRLLVWGDFTFGETPFVLIRETSTKDRKQRPIPLHPRLAAEIEAFRPADVRPDQRVFPADEHFPQWEDSVAALKVAGIKKTDDLGRTLHLHALRKTFQTLGVKAGINQRSAQELLGHTDPRLTAGVYTDVAALELHSEVRKLPWPDQPEKVSSEVVTQTDAKRGLTTLLVDLVEALQSPDIQGELSTLTATRLSSEMVLRKGLEPLRLSAHAPQTCVSTNSTT